MRTATRALLVVAIFCVMGTAHAQTVNWTYVEGGYANFDPDHGSRQDGWFVGGSLGLGKMPIHIIADWGSLDNIDVFQIGLGWHGLLGKRADLFADASYYDIDIGDGFRARFGARWMVAKRFELNGYLSWADLDLFNNTSASVGGIFDFTKRLGVGAAYEWGDEFSTAHAFVRFNFGQRG